MGSGWFGAMGSGWFDAMGSGWFDGGTDRAGTPVFPMAPDSPLADEPITPFYFGAKFPNTAWDSDLYALNIIPEFLASGLTINGTAIYAGPGARAIVIDAPPKITDYMINELIEKAITIRPQRLAEIMQQDKNFQTCWLQLLMMTHNSHPATYQLMKFAARVGELVMMAAKRFSAAQPGWNSARPSQICPTLYPPVPVPGHSTYPAGHAIVGHLTSECLKDLFPDPSTVGAATPKGVRASLDKLALRVSENRVIAGLHFEHDIIQGKLIAHQVAALLKGCPLYTQVLATAKQEWMGP
jgi:hypothetical protein